MSKKFSEIQDHHLNTKQKKFGMAVIKDKEEHFMMIRMFMHHGDIRT